MNWINTKDQLPEEGKYVLTRHNRGTWIDSTDQENVNCVVLKLVKGISLEEREKMKNGQIPDFDTPPSWCLSEGFTISKRSNIYRAEDQHGNNLVPYNWQQFGPDSFFGQTITHWTNIDNI